MIKLVWSSIIHFFYARLQNHIKKKGTKYGRQILHDMFLRLQTFVLMQNTPVFSCFRDWIATLISGTAFPSYRVYDVIGISRALSNRLPSRALHHAWVAWHRFNFAPCVLETVLGNLAMQLFLLYKCAMLDEIRNTAAAIGWWKMRLHIDFYCPQ